MNSLPRTLLGYLAAAMLGVIVYLFVAGIWFPEALEPLSPVLCPNGATIETNELEIEVARRVSDPYRIWCSADSDGGRRIWEDVTDRWIGLMIGLGVATVVVLLVRSRIGAAEFQGPPQTATR